ncbi:MAG: NUDIX hydrolase [Deltaproteobacteria bacterium]|nr:NUDIX hydrolase [Deltaproteobacteria bacterium]
MTYCYKYPRPMVTVDTVILKAEPDNIFKLLLIKRKNDPFADCWALPGGFVDMDEDLDAAAKRELLEETGIAVDSVKEIGAFGTPGRDPRGRNICVAFGAVVHDELFPKGGDDAKEAELFDMNHLPELAFDHEKIIMKAIKVLIK